MDVVRLGPAYNTSWIPDEEIEGYSSFIWTERFYTDGEFELHTPNVKKTLQQLPTGTLISHLDTDEVCVVENHSIELQDTGKYELTVSGRSLTSIIEGRFVESTYQKRRKMRKQYSTTGAAAVLLWNALDNGSGKDVTRGDSNADSPEQNDYDWTLKDKVTNVAITDSVVNDGEQRRWWLEEGMLLPQLQKMLARGDFGLRVIRPLNGSSGKIISVTVHPLADRGDITRTDTSNIMQLRFDLYDGVDRSVDQNVVDPVQFSTLQGDLSKAQYLYSEKDYRTIMEILAGVSVGDVSRTNAQGNLTGMERRVSSFDAGAPEIPPEPERPDELKQNATTQERQDHADAMDVWIDKHANWKNRRDNIVEEFREDAQKDALRELKKARRVSLLSGDVSPISPFRIRRDYNLGDKVTITSDYAPPENVIVSEYIRAENTSDGDRGYPTFTAP